MKMRAGSFIAGVIAIVAIIASDARAADYPTHPIKLVVPYAAGDRPICWAGWSPISSARISSKR